MKKIHRLMKSKRGSGVILAVVILLSSITILSGVLIVATTYSTADSVKSEVKTAALSCLKSNYLDETVGYSRSELSVSDILSYLQENDGLTVSGATGIKSSNGQEQYSINNLSVESVEKSDSHTQDGEKITYTFKRPIYFGSGSISPVSVPVTIYIWNTSDRF